LVDLAEGSYQIQSYDINSGFKKLDKLRL
jgi:hypothetical protein